MSIFAGSTINEQYQVTDASDGKTAASLNKVSDPGFVAGTDIDHNVAFYPYVSTAAIAKSAGSYVISDIKLPATQTYAEGSFGNGAFPMAAVTGSTGDMNLKFKNVLGGLKLQLKGTASIASISITGNNNEVLCGAAEVTVANGNIPSINLTDASAKTVTLDCGAGVALNSETATSFIIALPPITMTGGFTVIVTDTEGKQMEIKTTKSQTITRSSLLRMPAVTYMGTPIGPDYSKEPFTITSTGSTAVSISTSVSSYVVGITLEYRKGTDSWAEYTIGSTVSLSDGESLQFRAGEEGNTTFSKGTDGYRVKVSGDGTIGVSGNIMSLLDKNLLQSSVPSYAFCRLFSSTTTRLVDASNLILPATILADRCYLGMFEYCSGLITAPKHLPAMSLAISCYASMFDHCTSLITTPELPAMTMAAGCYLGMFRDCTSLTTAPSLPATALQTDCYSTMFWGCTSLTTVPTSLPARTLARRCYSYMFKNCTSLTTAPILPATSLVESCYDSMFDECTNLNYIKMLAVDVSASSCLRYWLYGVAKSGTFVKNSSATWNISGSSGIPSGWTIITE